MHKHLHFLKDSSVNINIGTSSIVENKLGMMHEYRLYFSYLRSMSHELRPYDRWWSWAWLHHQQYHSNRHFLIIGIQTMFSVLPFMSDVFSGTGVLFFSATSEVFNYVICGSCSCLLYHGDVKFVKNLWILNTLGWIGVCQDF
jgi:hypothetical protein